MYKKLLILSLAVLSFGAVSGEAEIKWVNADKYTDLKGDTKSDEARVQQAFFKTMQEEANKFAKENLPSNQKLVIAIYDVDLAGSVRLANGNGRLSLRRVVKDETPPGLSVGYIVVDDSGKEIKSGAKALTVTMFRNRGFDSSRFFYETRLLNDYLSKELG